MIPFNTYWLGQSGELCDPRPLKGGAAVTFDGSTTTLTLPSFSGTKYLTALDTSDNLQEYTLNSNIFNPSISTSLYNIKVWNNLADYTTTTASDFTTSGTYCWYKTDETSGSTFLDSSGNGYDGEIQGTYSRLDNLETYSFRDNLGYSDSYSRLEDFSNAWDGEVSDYTTLNTTIFKNPSLVGFSPIYTDSEIINQSLIISFKISEDFTTNSRRNWLFVGLTTESRKNVNREVWGITVRFEGVGAAITGWGAWNYTGGAFNLDVEPGDEFVLYYSMPLGECYGVNKRTGFSYSMNISYKPDEPYFVGYSAYTQTSGLTNKTENFEIKEAPYQLTQKQFIAYAYGADIPRNEQNTEFDVLGNELQYKGKACGI